MYVGNALEQQKWSCPSRMNAFSWIAKNQPKHFLTVATNAHMVKMSKASTCKKLRFYRCTWKVRWSSKNGAACKEWMCSLKSLAISLKQLDAVLQYNSYGRTHGPNMKDKDSTDDEQEDEESGRKRKTTNIFFLRRRRRKVFFEETTKKMRTKKMAEKINEGPPQRRPQ